MDQIHNSRRKKHKINMLALHCKQPMTLSLNPHDMILAYLQFINRRKHMWAVTPNSYQSLAICLLGDALVHHTTHNTAQSKRYELFHRSALNRCFQISYTLIVIVPILYIPSILSQIQTCTPLLCLSVLRTQHSA